MTASHCRSIEWIKLVHPSSLVVVGASSSGKTSTVCRLIACRADVYNFPLQHVYYVISQFSTVPSCLANDPLIHVVRGLPEDLTFVKEDSLLVLDDLQAQSNTKQLAHLFTVLSHHKRISVVLCLHNLFWNDRHARLIALNTSYLLLKSMKRDPSSVFRLAQQLRPTQAKQIFDAYLEATRAPYSDFLIDLTQQQKEALRFRSKFLPDEPWSEIYTTHGDLVSLQDELAAEG